MEFLFKESALKVPAVLLGSIESDGEQQDLVGR